MITDKGYKRSYNSEKKFLYEIVRMRAVTQKNLEPVSLLPFHSVQIYFILLIVKKN